MKSVAQGLVDYPHKIFRTSHDEEAKKFIFEFGLTNNFKMDETRPLMQIVTWGKHETHFIIIAYFTGKTLKTDNGFSVVCLPKSHYDEVKIAEFLTAMTQGQGEFVSNYPLRGDHKNN